MSITNISMNTIYKSLLCLFLLTQLTCFATEVNSFDNQRQAVDQAHQKFANIFYKNIIQTPQIQATRFNSIAELSTAVENENNNNQSVKSVALILRNAFLLTRDYDKPQVISLVKTVLDNNALINAKILITQINEQGDDRINTQLNYLLADFYFQREQWAQAVTYLENDLGHLPQEQYNHALLMQGIALQKQSKHRLSMTTYEKIPNTSTYYTAAQLNIALANLRQGWWTEGHQIISELLEAHNALPQVPEKTLNRLYITLGYSLLNQAYYRNARKAFQSVGVSSRYSNQALLGIALTAAHQDDYIGALNTTRVLKAKEEDDLPVDEAYLLMPFFYEKSEQFDTASLGYSQAASFYQTKIFVLNSLIKSPINFNLHPIDLANGANLHIDDTRINFLSLYPKYTFIQRNNAEQFQAFIENSNETLPDRKKLIQGIDELNKQYNLLADKMASHLISIRVSHLQSYLNQSRYGLARLFDNNTDKNNADTQ
ncbi:tetratricopeptide repeat protein [Colwellia echini]|uniref:Tetratricopeptide repeat-containing protein n=1 Tax=Colwellia echini TaxID=1982103 RepID=A0ABY3MW87_9GAMM|nr:hypothetical protein [Colwellia echini]TYK65449.1 hypothetical protein CWS31_010155 [Colwellia echini]